MIIIESGDDRYPEKLKYIQSPPKELYCIGDVSLLKRRCVAVVGARKASTYGRWIAYQIGKMLAENDIVTVSGMAYGCDAEAHRGALDAGGKTIAVMGCGVDICYPKTNELLRSRIIDEGLIISEYPPETKPTKFTFPQRNRLISGISEAVAVAEAGLSSGSLITAACAADQGKNVFAVPGNITSVNSIGCNKLIQDGALPVVFIGDILEGIGIHAAEADEKLMEKMGEDELRVYEILCREGEVTFDFIAKSIKKSVPEVNGIVGIMEMKGFLSTSMGKIFIAK